MTLPDKRVCAAKISFKVVWLAVKERIRRLLSEKLLSPRVPESRHRCSWKTVVAPH